MAAVTEAKLEFNLGDSKADTIDKAIKAVDNIMYVGWVSSYIRPFKLVRNKVAPNSRKDSHQVLMFITDGLDLSGSVQREAKYLRDNKHFEVYAIGKVGTLGSRLFTFGALVRSWLGTNVNKQVHQNSVCARSWYKVPATWIPNVFLILGTQCF